MYVAFVEKALFFWWDSEIVVGKATASIGSVTCWLVQTTSINTWVDKALRAAPCWVGNGQLVLSRPSVASWHKQAKVSMVLSYVCVREKEKEKEKLIAWTRSVLLIHFMLTPVSTPCSHNCLNLDVPQEIIVLLCHLTSALSLMQSRLRSNHPAKACKSFCQYM